MCGHWRLWSVSLWSANDLIEIFLNAWIKQTNKIPNLCSLRLCLCWKTLSSLGLKFTTLPLPLRPLAQGLTVSQRWEFRAFGSFLSMYPAHGTCVAFIFPRICGSFSELLFIPQSISLPSFFCQAFSHLYYLPQLITFVPTGTIWFICLQMFSTEVP